MALQIINAGPPPEEIAEQIRAAIASAMPEAAIAREVGVEYACIALIVNRAAGRGDVPIHDDVEASTAAARNATMSTLRSFFGAL